MDQRALMQLVGLRQEIEDLRKRKARMQRRSTAITHILNGMPRGSSVPDRTGDFGSELAYLDIMIDNAIARCVDAFREAWMFIDAIGESEMRQIMRHRYLDGMTWQDVANAIGEQDEQYPRRRHNAYLHKCGQEAFKEERKKK